MKNTLTQKMACSQPSIISLLLISSFFLTLFTSNSIARIGETEAQCDVRYGVVKATTPDGRRVYNKSGFRVIISFRDGAADSITYVKTPDESESQKAFDEVIMRGNTNLNLSAVLEKNSPDISLDQIQLILKSNYDKSQWNDLLLESILKDPKMPPDAANSIYKLERDFTTADGCLKARVYPDFHKLLIAKKKSFSKAVALEESVNLKSAKERANLQGL